MARQAQHHPFHGFTITELMIAIAILSVLAAIAIPLYRGYILEGHFASMRTTLNGMRTSIEDFRLENGNYGPVGNLVDIAAIDGRFAWQPAGDTGAYTYTVAVTGTNSYDLWGVFDANNAIWARCDNRYQSCCDSETTGSTSVIACP